VSGANAKGGLCVKSKGVEVSGKADLV
jgi:hypothetical protein